jgi:predicted acylesterase/phospholipase RssA
LHTLRILAGIAVAVMACTLLPSSPPLPWGSAQAQMLAEVRKKVEKRVDKKGPVQKDQQDRPPLTAEDEAHAVIPGIADARAWGDSETDFAPLLPKVEGPWLAISGGGADGAFGGGVLAGWSESGTRPEFAVVTGASIGALVAPFAFLGPRYDEEIRKNFTTITSADIFEDRITRDSLFDYWPLKRLIEQRVTPKLLSDIAAEHARGRRLYIATTNLDAGRRVVWNMGAIAAKGDDKAIKLFRDVLLASSSIPGFFSPVGIEVEANGKQFEEMHSDGTLTAPFFVVPESMFSPGTTSPPPLRQLYVLVNAKVAPEFSVPTRSIPGVLGRSIAVALQSALRAEILLVNVGAQRHKIELHIAHVDPTFNYPIRGVFDGKYMQALYDVGVAAGKNGTAFGDALPAGGSR